MGATESLQFLADDGLWIGCELEEWPRARFEWASVIVDALSRFSSRDKTISSFYKTCGILTELVLDKAC